MYTTLTHQPAAATEPDVRRGQVGPVGPVRHARLGLLGGIGGLVFVAGVVVQNTLRSKFPATDATAEEVMRYYADHRGATLALAALVPVGLVAIVTFVGALLARVGGGAGRVPAIAGAFGAAGIIANFAMVTATDLAISGYIRRGSADLAVVDGMWVVHNAIFGVLFASVGIALAGFTLAGARDGLLSKRWAVAGPIGGALLLIGAATTPAIIEGGPTLFLGLAGFAVWLAFVVRSSIALLRDSQV